MARSLPRSPLLMSADQTALLVVDMQTKLLNLIDDGPRVIWNAERLLTAAKLFGLPAFATEQYPKGLGPTDSQLTVHLGPIPSKTRFSCGECGELFDGLQEQGIRKILVCGIEAHVCVQQTVLDLLTAGFELYVAVDAVASRYAIDYQTALKRMELSGATLTTTESALFEWCEDSTAAQFKQVSGLVQQKPPI